jgi:hypothetical protein
MKIVRSVFQMLFLWSTILLRGQSYGCTDPAALNYNSSASANDGSCLYPAASVTPVVTFNLTDTLSETSGLISWNNGLWTHNDNTDTHIYSLDTVGHITQAYSLPGIVNTDWEEISQDDQYVYIGDFGNNANGNRRDLRIFRIEKNSLLVHAPVIDTIGFSYSDQTDFSATGSNHTDFDCEAFIVSADSIFLFTKQWIKNKTSMYSLSKKPGVHSANLKYTLDVQGLVTGAVYLESKRLIALSGYSGLMQPFVYLLYDFSGSDYFGANKRKITVALPFHQVEGIATANGLSYYISNEYFSYPQVITTMQKLHVLDLRPFLNSYITSITGSPENEKQTDLIVSYDPAGNSINVHVPKQPVDLGYRIFDSQGTVVLSGKLNTPNTRIGLAGLANGMYLFCTSRNTKKFFKVKL